MGAIEVFGPPGAGKSTIVDAVKSEVEKYGWPGSDERHRLGPELQRLQDVALGLLGRSKSRERGKYDKEIRSTLARAERIKGEPALIDEGVTQRMLTIALALPGDAAAIRDYAEAAPIGRAVAVIAPADVLVARNNERGTPHFARHAEWLIEVTRIAAGIWGAEILDGTEDAEANAQRVAGLLALEDQQQRMS